MKAYAKDHNDTYPQANNWCDVLIKNYNVNPKQFRCPASDARAGQSSYAININIAGKKTSEVSPETVLLFETKPGVNPAGGPEMVITENHEDGCCNILYGDGHAKSEIFAKGTPNDLRWKAE
jgi:prepilin-type processing-associated H-X9-DG protein